ncbi:MAG: cyclic nucleotide-binding domain-containing protein [Chloroflexi bacterium]|nr:cyclic nucleotide-binding domain-containing protein [Chloroflexota bacterium]
MARDEKIDLLRSVPLFKGIGDRQLERISVLADIIDLPANRRILSQGERGAEMFVMVRGSARVERDGALLADAGPGAVLGEIALLDGGPRTATVTLTEASRLLVLARREFQTLLDEFPDVRLHVFEMVARRLRALDREAVH